MRIRPFEKIAFCVSVAVLMFLYGYGTATIGWFPDRLMEQALLQAHEYLSPPRFLSERVYGRDGVDVLRPEDVAGGVTLISTHREEWNWRAGLLLVAEDGRELHSWRADPAEIFAGASSTRGVRASDRGAHGVYLFPNGDVILHITLIGTARLDACGRVVWRLPTQGHHSLARADDGTFWLPTTTRAERPRSARYPDGYPGLDRPVNHDHLLRMSTDGEVLDSISVLDLLYENGLVRYLAKARLTRGTDLTHVNDVESLSNAMASQYPLFEAGDLLVSIRASDLVLVVDPDTEQVKWHMADPFVHQHDPDFIGDGWIGIFDNARDGTKRGKLLGGSRIVAVEAHTGSVKVLFPTLESEPFYTRFLGKWQLLGNGNLLLTEGTTGRVVEVTPEGRSVWEWVHEGFDESHTVEVTEGSRYGFTEEQVAEWPCGRA